MSSLRSLRQLTATTSRALIARQFTPAVHRVIPLTSKAASVSLINTRSFSVSVHRSGEGTTDPALIQKLQEELNYEKDIEVAEGSVPEFLQAFKAQGVWEIKDTPGQDEVALTRKFGNENITLMFSIADIQAEEEDFESDKPEEEDSDREEGESEDEPFHMYPIRTSLTVTKNNTPGCLSVDMVCQEGSFVLENASYYGDAKVGTDLTAEADWKRRGLYVGPQFDTLDVGLQEELEKYLQERGVNDTVALFIPEYAEYKEQNEYVKWLGHVKSFVEQ